MGKKPRLEFLWAWFAQMLNAINDQTGTTKDNALSPAYIHVLLKSLKVSGSQLRYTFDVIGHRLLEFIYHEILIKKKDALTTRWDPSGTKATVNTTEYLALTTDFDNYRRGETMIDPKDPNRTIQLTEPNSQFPFDVEEKVIVGNQTSEAHYQDIIQGQGDRLE